MLIANTILRPLCLAHNYGIRREGSTAVSKHFERLASYGRAMYALASFGNTGLILFILPARNNSLVVAMAILRLAN